MYGFSYPWAQMLHGLHRLLPAATLGKGFCSSHGEIAQVHVQIIPLY